MAKKRPPTKKCRRCNGPFYPRRKGQVYCTGACRREDYKEKYYSPTETEKECPECGELFSTTSPKKQTYCTPECRSKGQGKVRDKKTARDYAESLTTLGERYSTFKKDNFRCTVCGQGAQDTVLDVDTGEDGNLKTVCVECKAGKKFTKGGQDG